MDGSGPMSPTAAAFLVLTLIPKLIRWTLLVVQLIVVARTVATPMLLRENGLPLLLHLLVLALKNDSPILLEASLSIGDEVVRKGQC